MSKCWFDNCVNFINSFIYSNLCATDEKTIFFIIYSGLRVCLYQFDNRTLPAYHLAFECLRNTKLVLIHRRLRYVRHFNQVVVTSIMLSLFKPYSMLWYNTIGLAIDLLLGSGSVYSIQHRLYIAQG
jgi:hypothetical protein